jgi:hypothetical protein
VTAIRRIGWALVFSLPIFVFGLTVSSAQRQETVNGVRLVHNEKGGAWAGSPKVKIELVRMIGGLDEKDPNLAFSSPYDVVRDKAGNVFVLDSRECRVQMIDSEGRFLRSIGRRGQGPGEFQSPFSMDIDEAGLLFVFDAMGRKIEVLSAEGKPLNTLKFDSYANHQIRRLASRRFAKGGSFFLRDLMARPRRLPRLLTIIDHEGRTVKEFGDPADFKDPNVNAMVNRFDFDADAGQNICLSFWCQNRVEKYDPDGNLVWRADRPLNYGTDVIDKGRVETSERGTSIQAPRMNTVSTGTAFDGRGRIWVNTWNRQMSDEEMGASITVGGITRTTKQAKVGKMDIHKLEVFAPDGLLLGAIPLGHLAHGIRIFGDTLFVWERTNAAVYQYRIVELP